MDEAQSVATFQGKLRWRPSTGILIDNMKIINLHKGQSIGGHNPPARRCSTSTSGAAECGGSRNSQGRGLLQVDGWDVDVGEEPQRHCRRKRAHTTLVYPGHSARRKTQAPS